jgi:hypothetical protein
MKDMNKTKVCTKRKNFIIAVLVGGRSYYQFVHSERILYHKNKEDVTWQIYQQ